MTIFRQALQVTTWAFAASVLGFVLGLEAAFRGWV